MAAVPSVSFKLSYITGPEYSSSENDVYSIHSLKEVSTLIKESQPTP
jgi:hypothetical protein